MPNLGLTAHSMAHHKGNPHNLCMGRQHRRMDGSLEGIAHGNQMVSRGEKGNLCVTTRAIKERFLRNDFYLSLLLLDDNNDHL